MAIRKLTFLLFALFLATAASAQAQQESAEQLTLEAIFASDTFASEAFQGGRWAEEGPVITYIEQDASGATNLIRYDLENDTRRVFIDGSALSAQDVGRRIAIEDYQFSADGRRVLLFTDTAPVWRFNTQGFYYVLDLESGTLTPLSKRELGYQLFAKFSPDGRHAAFVRDRNLFLVDLTTMRETPLTTDGSPGSLINGTSDWVYEEEFGLRDGWAWSPEGRYLAFYQFDETATPDFVMTDLRGQYPTLTQFRYPKAGESNSEIRVGVIDVAARETKFFDTDTWREGGDETEYLPLMGWTPPVDGQPRVWIVRLNRDQNALDLLYGDPQTGDVAVVLEEREDTWIDVETGFSDLDTGKITYLGDGEHFAWISEADGYRHLYLHRNDGTLVRRLTGGDWDVTSFHGIDEARGQVYFTAAREDPKQRHLYRAPLGEGGSYEPVRITAKDGWHAVNTSRDLRFFIDTYSNATTPPVTSLHAIEGEPVKVLESNEALQQTLATYDLPAPEFLTVPGADGTPLEAMLIKPRDFDPSRAYPLLVYTYGGPGSQEVRDMWYRPKRRLWHHYLAEQQGVLVAIADGRGAGGRGKAFKSAVYKRLGQLEVQDQIAAAQYFGRQAYVDVDHLGIWGWSYGGYLTLMAMLSGDGPQTFRMGMAVAPVTDWRQYDTIYTERYMSTPQKNEAGYRQGAPRLLAGEMREDQHLLLVHGDLDDNVHFQNAVQMIAALQAAGKQFDLMVYPGLNHALSGSSAQLHLFTMMTKYVRDHLVEAAAVGASY